MQDNEDAVTTPTKFPQAIAHRGYSATFPENTMAAFRGAVAIGAHAIETDVHLSKDGVIVLSHDPTLKRCFGEPRRIADCDWEYLSKLRTLGESREAMPRLVDLLSYLSEPEQEHIWLLLDIKRQNNPNMLCPSLAAAVDSVPTTGRPWKERIILAPWKAEWVSACLRHLPGFPIALTAYSPTYASAMLEVPNLHFSLLNYSFASYRGTRFHKKAREQPRMIFSWSDNADEWMSLSIRNKVDGVITDDPKRFIRLCSQWDSDAVREKASRPTIRQTALWVFVNILVVFYEVISALMEGSPSTQVKRALHFSSVERMNT